VRQSLVGGRRCAVVGEPVAARIGLQAADVLGDRVVGRGHPGKRATGLGVLEVGRRTASGGWLPWSRETAFGQARACAYLGSDEQVLKGTNSTGSPGTWIVAPARENLGPDTTAGHRVS
jgi:hypothetical protein